MRGFLLLAAIYNLIWGLFIYNFPEAYYAWISGEDPVFKEIVKYQGLGILFFAGAFLTAAIYPLKVWYLVWAGFLAKLFGGLLVYVFVMEYGFTKKFLFQLLMNDLIWVLPLLLIALKIHAAKKQAA